MKALVKKIVLLFMLLLVGFYYGPIFYDEREVPTHETETVNNVVMENEEVTVIHPLPVSGFEHYVGQNIQTYAARHGDPTIIYSEGPGESNLWVYYSETHNFIQIEVRNSIIQSLFVLGSDIQTGAIQIGMNRNNVYDETLLSRRFEFDWLGETVSLALTREEWEHFPLVQFDNNSFAMLYFHPEKNDIYAIRYLSPETLVDMNYYSVTGIEAVAGTSVHKNTGRLLEHYINAIRTENDLDLLASSEKLNEYGNEILQSVGTNELTFNGLSAEIITAAEKEEKLIAYNVSANSVDAPMRFGLMLLNASNRALFLDPFFTGFSIISSNDDLLLVFESEGTDSSDY